MNAWLGCLLIAVAYVAPLHLWRKLPRNHPATVRRRLAIVLAVCCLTWVPLWLALRRQLPGQPSSAVRSQLLRLLGLSSAGLLPAAALALALTATLFAAPLLLLLLDWREGQLAGHFQGVTATVAVRNYVVGPLTEEWAFRACMTPMLLLQGVSTKATVLASPLFFGVAHLHHLHELVAHQGYPLLTALAAVAFQTAFTTLFGWYATYLYLRTGQLPAVVLVHAFCNALGFPDISRMWTHRNARALLLLLVSGIAGFAAGLVLLRPGWAWRNDLPRLVNAIGSVHRQRT